MARIFSGIQPSGELHIGNYLGAVKNWVQLQHQFESFFCIVNYHAITGTYEPADLARRTHEMAIGLLAAGIDPSKATLFVQSQVPEHTELAWIFNTLTPLGELERQVAFKERAARQEQVMAGILNYPVLQAADILLYLADLVPVGEDQVQHLELSRVVARNWNARFSPEPAFFPEPQPRLTPTRRIVGLDGQAKMSKSLGNTIGVLEEPDAIWEKLRPAVTDPARQRKSDPGDPEKCPTIYPLHKAFSPEPTVREVEENCRGAKWGCIDCKKALHVNMLAELTPIRERAAALKGDPARVTATLDAGAAKARNVAQQTITRVKEKWDSLWRSQRRSVIFAADQVPTMGEMVEAFRLDLAAKLVVAVLLGGAIGLERQLAGKASGLRTNILICLGSALLMHLSMTLGTSFGGDRVGDPGRIAAQIVTGIGFIGAGTIMQSRGAITGLTSAASIWVVAAIGMTVGAGFFTEALSATLVVMLVLAGLGKVEHKLLRVTRTRECTIRTKPGVTLEWMKTALFADGLVIVKAQLFDHDDDRVFELSLRGPARQFDIARAELLDRAEVLNVMLG